MDDYFIALALIALSALFSGLTLGLLSLDSHTLKRRAKLGDEDARAIYPIRKNGNLLLTTLLLGNVTVNTTLSIFLGSIITGVVAVVVATALIFLFGEILPQAVFSRNAIWFGKRTVPFVRIATFIFYPIAYPISRALDKMLGDEIPTVYSKHEILEIISEHEDSEHSPIDEDEERIVHGALKFSHKKVREVMTPLADVELLSAETILDTATREKMADLGYSRFPVYELDRNNIIGILYTKDLITESSRTSVRSACERKFLKMQDTANLDTTLRRFIKSKQHLATVFDSEDVLVGVITLEDIIEEILQLEIEDEDDVEEA